MNDNQIPFIEFNRNLKKDRKLLIFLALLLMTTFLAICFSVPNSLGAFLVVMTFFSVFFYVKRSNKNLSKLAQSYEELQKESLNLGEALSVSALVSETDPHGTITNANPQFCRISQFSKEELIGQPHSIVKSEEHPAEFYKSMWDTLKLGQVWKGEIKNRAKDGSYYWVDATISPIFDLDGEIKSYIAVRFDITKRKEMEEQLRKKHTSLLKVKDQLHYALRLEKVLAEILEISSKPIELQEKLNMSLDLILKLDWLPIRSQGAIFLVSKDNPAELKLEAHINLAKPLQTLCAKVQFGHCLCGRAAEKKQIMFADCVDDRHDTRFDTMEPHGHYNVPLIFRGNLHGVMVIYLEVGHKKSRSEMDTLLLISRAIGQMIDGSMTIEALEKQRSKLIQSSKMSSLGEMAGGISHELNNPLAIVKGYASILRKQANMGPGISKKVVDDMTKKIENSVTRMTDIIEGLRNFARDGEVEVKREENLCDLIEETLSFCRGRFTKLSVDLDLQLEENITLDCQSVQISQVVLNLLNNALDAVSLLPQSAPKKVRVIAEKSDKKITVQVLDNGPGIEESVAQKMFQPFYTTKPIGKGTGLGLSISHGIVEAHNGQLTFSREDEWTCFSMTLPILRRSE